MSTETKPTRPERKMTSPHAASAPVYGLGLVGALIYYISSASSFWIGALGVLKSLVWPAMLVYEVLKFLNM